MVAHVATILATEELPNAPTETHAAPAHQWTAAYNGAVTLCVNMGIAFLANSPFLHHCRGGFNSTNIVNIRSPEPIVAGHTTQEHVTEQEIITRS